MQVEDLALDTQHGAILRSDALAAGMNDVQIDRRLRRGQWLPGPVRGSFIIASCSDNPLAQLAAATISLNAVAWGHSALGLWGLASHPARPELASPKQHRCAGIRATRMRALDQLRTVRRQQILTVPIEVGLASIASSSSRRALDETVDEALRQRLSTWPRIELAWRAFLVKGRPGSALLRNLIEDRSMDSAVPLSQWSRDFAARLVKSGLERPRMEWPISDRSGNFIAQVDLAYPEHRYAIELDSLAFHLNAEAFEVDRQRDSDLARQGWAVGRFTWKQCRNDWDQVIATVASQIKA